MTQILPYFEMRNVYNHFNLNVGLYGVADLHDPNQLDPELSLSVRFRPDPRFSASCDE